MFLVQARHGTWETGGSDDFMYFVGYAILTYGLLQLWTVAENTRAVIGLDGESRRFFNPMRFWKERVASAVDKGYL